MELQSTMGCWPTMQEVLVLVSVICRQGSSGCWYQGIDCSTCGGVWYLLQCCISTLCHSTLLVVGWNAMQVVHRTRPLQRARSAMGSPWPYSACSNDFSLSCTGWSWNEPVLGEASDFYRRRWPTGAYRLQWCNLLPLSPNTRDFHGWTPWSWSRLKGNENLCSYLSESTTYNSSFGEIEFE